MAAAVAAQIEALVVRLQQEGVLDEQFQQLMMLQDDSNPDFVVEVVQLYFEVRCLVCDSQNSSVKGAACRRAVSEQSELYQPFCELEPASEHKIASMRPRVQDSGTKIDKIGQMLMVPSPDYNELDQLVHQFKGSSASLGAQYIAQLCIKLREQCQQRDSAGCFQLQQQIKQAYADLKTKLEQFMMLEFQRKQLLQAGLL